MSASNKLSGGISKIFRSTGKFLDQVGQMLEVNPYTETGMFRNYFLSLKELSLIYMLLSLFLVQPSTRVVKLGTYQPKIAANFVAPTASVIGNVTIGENSSLWYGAIARGKLLHQMYLPSMTYHNQE
jgi:hypothetical protein